MALAQDWERLEGWDGDHVIYSTQSKGLPSQEREGEIRDEK